MWTIAIGDRKENISEVYRLYVRYMTGDADGFQTEHYDFADVEQLGLYLTVLNTYNSIGWNNQCDIENSAHWCKLGGVETGRWGDPIAGQDLTPLQHAFVRFGQNVPYEVGYDSDRQASPYDWYVTYFDAEGVERSTTITDADGVSFSLLRH